MVMSFRYLLIIPGSQMWPWAIPSDKMKEQAGCTLGRTYIGKGLRAFRGLSVFMYLR